jgi:hypothetical protein
MSRLEQENLGVYLGDLRPNQDLVKLAIVEVFIRVKVTTREGVAIHTSVDVVPAFTAVSVRPMCESHLVHSDSSGWESTCFFDFLEEVSAHRNSVRTASYWNLPVEERLQRGHGPRHAWVVVVVDFSPLPINNIGPNLFLQMLMCLNHSHRHVKRTNVFARVLVGTSADLLELAFRFVNAHTVHKPLIKVLEVLVVHYRKSLLCVVDVAVEEALLEKEQSVGKN